jgi:hypothetical protein
VTLFSLGLAARKCQSFQTSTKVCSNLFLLSLNDYFELVYYYADPVDDIAKPQKGFCTGCLQEVNKEDEKVIELANSAIEELNGGQLSATPHKLFKVLSAHRQVIIVTSKAV